MTNEEAKKMLEAKLKCLIAETSGTNYDCNMRLCDGCSLNYEQGNIGEQKQALDMAIKALEQQPCEDCISRKAVIELIGEDYGKWLPYAIMELPSVTPQPKTGKWIVIRCEPTDIFKCSECGMRVMNPYRYCHNCGARMGVEDEDSD